MVALLGLGLLGALTAATTMGDSPDDEAAPATTLAPMTSASATPPHHATTTTADPALPSIYAGIGPEQFAPGVADDLRRVYVPSGRAHTVSVIDPTTYQVVGTFRTGREPQHVVPSFDLQTLWVLLNQGNKAIPIEAATGVVGAPIDVIDPYNLYFTPDGSSAIVVAEALRRLDFRDPHTMALSASLPVPGCAGINHADYDRDGRYLIATCEFAGQVVKIDMASRQVVGYLDLATLELPGQPHPAPMRMPEGSTSSSMPQDIRAAPDGRHFYVADMMAGGVFVLDGDTFEATAFVATGTGAHGITPSRDGTRLFVANRGRVDDLGPAQGARQRQRARHRQPGGGGHLARAGRREPRHGQPRQLAVASCGSSGRYDAEVYVFDTTTGELTHRIPVGQGPHGLTYWPQPGTRSLGHTGNMR